MKLKITLILMFSSQWLNYIETLERTLRLLLVSLSLKPGSAHFVLLFMFEKSFLFCASVTSHTNYKNDLESLRFFSLFYCWGGRGHCFFHLLVFCCSLGEDRDDSKCTAVCARDWLYDCVFVFSEPWLLYGGLLLVPVIVLLLLGIVLLLCRVEFLLKKLNNHV